MVFNPNWGKAGNYGSSLGAICSHLSASGGILGKILPMRIKTLRATLNVSCA